ncbi:Pkinase-domain-containing protein [Cristinia sonorae]|uniref:Pkinase-domain-containing protein n=1 Tax=Cristinia sonorae TaxID=1940300 RepID=A0A8K0UVY4_9AGAR|nr:Pkinase-domain-containing protein [Cristinia sonorae]
MQQPPPPKRNASTTTSSSSSSNPPSSLSATRSPNGSSSTITFVSSSSSNGSGSHSKGQIHVKLISARGLNVRSPRARPYVVVQFEQNEFVSREPTDESDKEVKGVATNLSRNSSSTALSALSVLNGRSGLPSAHSNGHHSNGQSTPNGNTRSANHSPSSSAGSGGSGKSGLSAMFGAARISAHNPVWKHEVSFDVTSEQSAITFNVYDRAVSDLGFLGTVQIKPALVHDHTVDQWYKLQPNENEPVTGEMRVQITFEASKTKRALTPRDFEFLKLIGRGTFGRVFQVRKKDTKRIYAMKVLSKREIIAKKEVAHTIGERKILQRSLESPFLVGLKFSFQTDADLYLVTDFKSGGELFWHLQKETRFSEERARFYIAELVLALEHLHKYDIVYRDLKPENILLDATGHVALCDFGLSKPDLRSDELTNTFCGTTEYLAPEVLLDEHGYSKLVDFWSLGVLLFEMCCGWSPFYAEDTQQMYKNICFGRIRFPKGVINEDGKQFVKGLLNRNPKHRLGAQHDAADLKAHPFFKTIDWEALSRKQVTPPFKPVVESDESVANFDPEFTSADVREQALSDWDDEDPSEAWVSQSYQTGAVHTPNGPLGSDKPPNAAATTATAMALTSGVGTVASNGIQMPQKKKHKDAVGTPLTSSVQENFRGFTYHGESLAPEAGFLAEQVRNEELAVQDDETPPLRSAEEELLDLESPVGRYAQQRRGISLDGFDDELQA